MTPSQKKCHPYHNQAVLKPEKNRENDLANSITVKKRRLACSCIMHSPKKKPRAIALSFSVS